MRKLIAVLALGAVVAACSEQATSPQPRTPAIAADLTNNPKDGPVVFRWEDDNSWSWINEDASYRLVFFTDPLWRCGHQFPSQSTGNQLVLSQDDWAHMVTLGQSVNVYVLDVTRPGDCKNWTLVGWSDDGRLKTIDNEAWWEPDFALDHANSWQWEVSANLTTVDGGRMHIRARTHCVQQPNAAGNVCRGNLDVIP